MCTLRLKNIDRAGDGWQVWIRSKSDLVKQLPLNNEREVALEDNLQGHVVVELRDDQGMLQARTNIEISEDEVDVYFGKKHSVELKLLQNIERQEKMHSQARQASQKLGERYANSGRYVSPLVDRAELRDKILDHLNTFLSVESDANHTVLRQTHARHRVSKHNQQQLQALKEQKQKLRFKDVRDFLEPATKDEQGHLLGDPLAGVLEYFFRNHSPLEANDTDKNSEELLLSQIKDFLYNVAKIPKESQLFKLLDPLSQSWIRYKATTLVTNKGNGRLEPDQLGKSLRDSTLQGAPSDNAAIYDYSALRMALPSLLSNRLEEEAYKKLLEKYKEAWKTYGDKAWILPEEISALAQIEELLQIAVDLGFNSSILEQLRSFGSILTERQYGAFSEEDRGKIFFLLESYDAIQDITPVEILEAWQASETYPAPVGGFVYHIPGDPTSTPSLRAGNSRYVQLNDPLANVPLLKDIGGGEEWKNFLLAKDDYTIGGIVYFNTGLPSLNNQVKLHDQRYLVRLETFLQAKRQEIRDAVALAKENISRGDSSGAATSSLEALSRLLNTDKHPFDREWDGYNIYTPRSVNFGVFLNYSQIWLPFGYQAGDLVNTIPLAPGETRKFSTKTVVSKSRKRKEYEAALSVLTDQSENTNRVEAEVSKRARTEQNFATHAEASGNIGPISASGSVDASTKVEKDVANTKKSMRQAVAKASQEFKNERKLELETSESTSIEEASSGEISNPNNEIVVTYLFYELQRRFMILDALTEVVPVVMVAGYVPSPSDVTESFLIQYDWILRRVLLDDSFREAFEIIKDTQKSRQVEVGVRKTAVERQLEALRETKEQLQVSTRLRDAALNQIKEAVDLMSASAVGAGAADTLTNIFTGGLSGLFGGGGGGVAEGIEEAVKFQEEAAQEALQRIDNEINRLRNRLEANTSALEQAIDSFAKVVRETLRREQQIIRARVHVAENIMYYMHAVWSYKYRDQRFFEIYDIDVPIISDDETDVNNADDEHVSVDTKLKLDGYRPLADVADLDNLLGFFGNYLIFPLRDNFRNPLTNEMEAAYKEYVLSENWFKLLSLLPGFSDKQVLPLAFMLWVLEWLIDSGALNDDSLSWVRKIAASISWQLTSIPSGHLHIEALPGKHPVLEDFKLQHRSEDVRGVKLENDRKEARIKKGILDDPDVDKQIQVVGKSDVTVATG